MRNRKQNGMANKMARSAAAEYPKTQKETAVVNDPIWIAARRQTNKTVATQNTMFTT
jgi:hypothetical protein